MNDSQRLNRESGGINYVQRLDLRGSNENVTL